MTRTSTIQHPPKDPFTMARNWYISLCAPLGKKKLCAAFVLAKFESYHNHNLQKLELNQTKTTTINRSLKNICLELNNLWSVNTVKTCLEFFNDEEIIIINESDNGGRHSYDFNPSRINLLSDQFKVDKVFIYLKTHKPIKVKKKRIKVDEVKKEDQFKIDEVMGKKHIKVDEVKKEDQFKIDEVMGKKHIKVDDQSVSTLSNCIDNSLLDNISNKIIISDKSPVKKDLEKLEIKPKDQKQKNIPPVAVAPLKKEIPKIKRKPNTPFGMVEIFNKNREKIIKGVPFTWRYENGKSNGKAFGSLKQLEKKIKSKLMHLQPEGEEITSEQIWDTWELILNWIVNSKDKWYLENFTPSHINSQFEKLVLKISYERTKPIDIQDASIPAEDRLAAFRARKMEGFN